jgi:AraC family ethanolamine operon transcriptional activator
MLFDQLSASSVLRICKFTGLEQLRAAQRFADTESIPLRMKSFAASRAILTLPGSTVVLFESFPRISDAVYKQANPVIMLPAAPVNGAIINGIPVTNNSIGFARGYSSYSLLEKAPNWYFSMVFNRSVEERGWPDVMDSFALFKAPSQLARPLRSTLVDILMSASGCHGDALETIALQAMEGSLLTALDRVFTGNVRLIDQRPSGLHLRLIHQIDSRLASNPSETIYSNALAKELGVSVRSLHSTTMSIRGMSLHRYLKVRRLWLVRLKLLSAEPGAKIKSFALAHGFWHLGDFSKDYQMFFGELPSQTLAGANHQST